MVGSKFIAIFLGTTGIGIVGLLQNTLAIISSVTGFGIQISGVRMVALAHSADDQEEFSKTILVLQRASIATGILGIILTLVLAKPLSIWTFDSSEHSNWFYILSINFIFSSLAISKMAILQGTRSMKAIALSTVVYAVLVTSISIPIYYYFRLEGIVAVLVLSAILNYLVNWFFVKKIKIVPVSLTLKETIVRSKELIQLGFLLSINVIFGHITAYLLKLYFNNQYANESVLGLYVVASTLLITYVGMIFSAMSTDFYPRLTAVQKDHFKIKEMVNDQIEIALLLITPLILLFYFLAPLIVQLLYSKAFLGVVLILKFALFAIIVKAIIWPLAFIILAKGEKKLYFKQEFVSDSMNIGFTILCYNYFGLVGIGLAMVLNYGLYGIYIYKITQSKFQFSFRKNTLRIIITSLLLGGLSAITVFVFDYTVVYFIMPFVCLISFYYSYVELSSRINVQSYFLKFKNKWKK